jgi:hypothetical protein
MACSVVTLGLQVEASEEQSVSDIKASWLDIDLNPNFVRPGKLCRSQISPNFMLA